MDKTRLNNFVLWCKNWYRPNKEMDIIAQAQKMLILDGYLPHNNPIDITLDYIDELVEKGVIKAPRLSRWNEEITRLMNYHDYSYHTAIMYRITIFFAFECDGLSLTPPVYSRKIYKMGFNAPMHLGNSYKLANYKANKFFKK